MCARVECVPMLMIDDDDELDHEDEDISLCIDAGSGFSSSLFFFMTEMTLFLSLTSMNFKNSRSSILGGTQSFEVLNRVRSY